MCSLFLYFEVKCRPILISKESQNDIQSEHEEQDEGTENCRIETDNRDLFL